MYSPFMSLTWNLSFLKSEEKALNVGNFAFDGVESKNFPCGPTMAYW